VTRVAIVGCGKIADQHVQAIARVEGSEVVGVCDREPLMAEQLAERFAVPGCFGDLMEMLRRVKPDVVHITTPPQTHYDLAKVCLESGSDVYLEKPFTVTAFEARSLLSIAEATGRKMTVGHNYQFTAEMLAMRQLVQEGFLGRPVHLDSYWSYDLGDRSYVAPLVGNSNHWVRRLPGQLLHNLISHGIARLAEFLDGPITMVHVAAHQSERLRAMGGEEVTDELRVLLQDGKGTTANFCFSTQIKPGRNEFRIFGSANSIAVDLSCGGVVRSTGRSYKSFLALLVPPVTYALEQARNAKRNALGIASGRLHLDSGMKQLIERFHQCVRRQAPLPIPYREILLTAEIMDAIFEQMQRSKSERGTSSRLEASAAGN
jgi:predicted dehydrogenase